MENYTWMKRNLQNTMIRY